MNNALKRISIILISVLSNFILFGQNTTKWLYDFQSPMLTFESTYFMGSPTVDNSFIDNYFNGAYLGEYMKNTTFNNLTPTNIFGAHDNFKLSFTMPVIGGGSTVAYYFAVENKNIVDLKFSDNLFKMIFDGNKQFAGDTLHIKDNFMTYTGFTQLKGGIVKQISSKGFQQTFLGILSLNIGTMQDNIHINNARFYTDAEGALLDTDLDMIYQSVKNKSVSKVKIANGLGTGIDFYYNVKSDKGYNFSVAFTDIGFVRWFKQYSNVIKKDTAFIFDGIDIKDILNINASTNALSKDSIQKRITNMTENKAYTSYLPMTMQLYFYKEISKILEIGTGMKYVFNAAEKPYYFVDAKYYIFQHLMISPTLSFGGYSGLNAGLDLGLNIRQYNFYIGSDYLTPYIDDVKFRGKGYYFKIVRKLSYGPKSFESSDYVKEYRNPRKPKYNANIFSNSLINKKTNFNENDTIKQP